MPPSETPNAPINAATEPPPGAGESLSVSLQNCRRFNFRSDFFCSGFHLEFDYLFFRIERFQLTQSHRANRYINQVLFRSAFRPLLFAEKIFSCFNQTFFGQHAYNFRSRDAQAAFAGGFAASSKGRMQG